MHTIGKALLLLCSLTSAGEIAAQTVSGKLIDENKQPLPYANVVLLALPDSTFVTGTVTAEDGTFSLNTTTPNQLVRISSIGYNTVYKPIQHTSAGLSVNENCDPDVRSDMEKIFNNLVRERESWYDHTLEGWDDMPAHAKSSLVGASLSIPITDGRLNLGTWQGIYLCEFRNHGGGRRIVATILGE